MQYNIHLNMRKINKFTKPFKMQQESVLAYVDIDPELLKEKDSWYFINSKVSFFKAREDIRIAGECISQAYAEAQKKEAAKYSVVQIDGKIGLMSENFQDKRKYRYFDFCQLHQLFPSFPKRYNYFTFKELLRTFEYHYDEETCTRLQQDLIYRYVFEWFTHQLDGNPRNTNLRQDKESGALELGPVFDKEQAFGVSESGFFDEEKLKIWVPSIPYEDISFRYNPYQLEGLDSNIFSLLTDYPEMTIKAMEDIFKIDYKAILETFVSGEKPFSLPKDTKEYLQGIVEQKECEKEKLLQLV